MERNTLEELINNLSKHNKTLIPILKEYKKLIDKLDKEVQSIEHELEYIRKTY